MRCIGACAVLAPFSIQHPMGSGTSGQVPLDLTCINCYLAIIIKRVWLSWHFVLPVSLQRGIYTC